MTREEAAEAIGKLYGEILFDEEEGLADINDTIFAAQHYMLALTSLKQAQHHMKLAAFFEARERGGGL